VCRTAALEIVSIAAAAGCSFAHDSKIDLFGKELLESISRDNALIDYRPSPRL
jgi:hypothetical protein